MLRIINSYNRYKKFLLQITRMKNWKNIEFYLGCFFLIQPVWYSLTFLYYGLILKTLGWGESIPFSIRYVGLSIVGAMLIISSHKNDTHKLD